jgi:5-methylcytosine-specific restriction endonuclease McrA
LAVQLKELPFCRENILVRDEFVCQYCGKKFPAAELTLDHVFPKSRLGPDIWENIVTCCKECNQKKADRTPKEARMKLLRRPYRPKDYLLFELKKYPENIANYWKQFFEAS